MQTTPPTPRKIVPLPLKEKPKISDLKNEKKFTIPPKKLKAFFSEVNELAETGTIEDLADTFEAMNTMLKCMNSSFGELERIRRKRNLKPSKKLLRKEVEEYRDAGTLEELSDVLNVMKCMLTSRKLSYQEIEDIVNARRKSMKNPEVFSLR